MVIESTLSETCYDMCMPEAMYRDTCVALLVLAKGATRSVHAYNHDAMDKIMDA
jgi:hypothetical protein